MSDKTYWIYCDDKADSKRIAASLADIGLNVRVGNERHGVAWLSPEIIVTGTTLLITILHAVIAVVKQIGNKTIRVKGKDGWEVEVPASIDKSDLEKLMESAKDRDQVNIIITK